MKIVSKHIFPAALLVATVVLAGGSISSSREPFVSQQSSSADMQRLFAAFNGTWKIHEIDKAESPSSNPPSGDGTEKWYAMPGGIPFVEEYHAQVGGREAFDVGLFWWDATTSTLRGSFCARIVDEGCSPFVVTWEGDAAVMRGEFVSHGNHYAWDERFTFDGPDKFTQTLDQAPVGEKLVRGTTIQAVRAK